MDILLHTCCTICLIYPYKRLKEIDYNPIPFFYNPNIHPYKEYQNRKKAFYEYTNKERINFLIKDDYALEEFLRLVVYREKIRCRFCYYMRLKVTAQQAYLMELKFFSTTLLASPYQNLNLIFDIALQIEKEFNEEIKFYYEDFSNKHYDSLHFAKKNNIYTQSYCGCIYSEILR